MGHAAGHSLKATKPACHKLQDFTFSRPCCNHLAAAFYFYFTTLKNTHNAK